MRHSSEIRVALSRQTFSPRDFDFRARTSGAGLPSTMGDWAALTDTKATVHGIPEGEWDVTVYATKQNAPMITTTPQPGVKRFATEREFDLVSHVAVRDGEETRLKEAPR